MPSSSTYEQSTLPRSKSSGSSQKSIILESCTKGDLVFVVWSMRHGQFMVVQDSPSLYFVHGDSLAALNLRLPQPGDDTSIPMPYYAIGRVVEKEYCQARKVNWELCFFNHCLIIYFVSLSCRMKTVIVSIEALNFIVLNWYHCYSGSRLDVNV